MQDGQPVATQNYTLLWECKPDQTGITDINEQTDRFEGLKAATKFSYQSHSLGHF